jgi:D,D-heptose 1,7-bisphosphate phosphatase
MLKQAVIQAGGKGTRLGDLTRFVPKPMIEVAGKPVLQHQLEWCKWNGITDVIIVVNHLGDVIEEFLKKIGKHFKGINISLVREPEALGTSGIFPIIKEQLEETFLVLYGDVLFDIDLERLIHFHSTKEADATLVVHPNDHPFDSDLVEVNDNDQVIQFLSKPHAEGLQYRNLVNAAFYVFSKNLIAEIPAGQKTDFGKDIFPKLVKNYKVFGYSTPEYLKDMGTPDRREAVEHAILSGKVQRRNLRARQKAIFLDRDGVLNYDTDLIHRTEDFQLYDFAASSLRKINKSDYLSVLTTNQSVVARNLIDLDGLRQIHNKMETDLGEQGAFLDAIYFCPHHPHGGFPEENPAFKVDCDCRKPKPGMILKATERFNINLKQSWMIGDSERDVLSGKAAGVKTIGVKTGHGQKKSLVEPDFFFSNVKEAVDFIIDRPMDDMVNEIIEHIPEREEPIVVCIAGNSRTGKTHLHRLLEMRLEEEKTSFFSIHLDDWILHRDARKENSDVFGNFDFAKIQKDLPRIFEGEEVSFPAYRRHADRPERHISYQYANEKVILIEGVISLSDEWLREKADLKVFLSCSPEEHYRRIKNFYQWKGFAEEEIRKQYEERLENEYKLIEKFAAFADLLYTT